MGWLIDLLARLGLTLLSDWLQGFGRKQVVDHDAQVEKEHEDAVVQTQQDVGKLSSDQVQEELQTWAAPDDSSKQP